MALEKEIIVGLHSIAAALENRARSEHKITATDEGIIEFQKKHKILLKNTTAQVDIVSGHALQERAKKIYQFMNLEFSRVPSGMFLETTGLPTFTLKEILDKNPSRLLLLDQITDVHNGAAILRTAAFYGVEGVIIPSEKSFGLTPSFYRISSGAAEYVPLIRVSSMSRAVHTLNENAYLTIGLSEHSAEEYSPDNSLSENRICLVLGAEETGLSHAVMRAVQKTMALNTQGKIKSLNVSSAAAIAMEKTFGN
jgi:23S rRNA (guanosine2251-2'-O)-methyltransferase